MIVSKIKTIYLKKIKIIYIYIYISFFTTSSATKTSQLKKKKKNPTTVLTLKIENKNGSIKNQNNLFLGGPRGAAAPPRPPLAPPLDQHLNKSRSSYLQHFIYFGFFSL